MPCSACAHSRIGQVLRNPEALVECARGEGLDHIGFVVDDVESTYREMNSKGAEPTGITPSETGGWQACVKDPDGNWIEFAKG